MLLIEEKTNEALMDRICYMLKYDINNYQKQILFNAIEEIKLLIRLQRVHEFVLLFCYNHINLLCLIN